MLVQRRWLWANIETALGQILRVLLARQPANHKLTTILEIESGVNHLQILTCEVAVSTVGSVW